MIIGKEDIWKEERNSGEGDGKGMESERVNEPDAQNRQDFINKAMRCIIRDPHEDACW